MTHKRARVNIPNYGNFIALEIRLRRFFAAPVRRNPRKFANDQALDKGPVRFFVFRIRADVSNVRIRQAHHLSGITWIGEYFLISGEAGIENNFSAAANFSAGGAPVEYSSVFERKCGGVSSLVRQRTLQYFEKNYCIGAAEAEIEPKWSIGQ